jgi:hypothetical protein
MNIIIISCPKLYGQRVPSLLEQLNRTKILSNSNQLTIISGSDALIESQLEAKYKPSEWSNYIKLGWGAFLGNLRNIQANNRNIEQNIFDKFIDAGPDDNFPDRFLSLSEISILNRHLYASMLASNFKGTSIILEDDARILNFVNADTLFKSICSPMFEYSYIDLADDYIPPWKHRGVSIMSNGLEFSRTQVAITRTLIGYAIDIQLADLDALPKQQHHAYRWWSKEDLMASPDVHQNTKNYFLTI